MNKKLIKRKNFIKDNQQVFSQILIINKPNKY